MDPPIQEKIKAVESNDKIKVFLGSRVFSISGAPGMFDVIIRPDGSWIEELDEIQNRWLAEKKARENKGTEEPEPAQTSQEEAAKLPPVPENLDFDHQQVAVGSVVLAAGWRPEEPSGLEKFGYGAYPDVITNVQMEELAAKGKLVRPSDGKQVNTVAFVEMVDDQIEHPWLYNSAVGSL